MSLDITIETMPCPHCGRSNEDWSRNITHNLTGMAEAAGIYEAMWHPDRLVNDPRSHVRGYHIREALEAGLKWLKDNPGEAVKYNPANGWGSYESLVAFVEDYILAIEEDEDGIITVSR